MTTFTNLSDTTLAQDKPLTQEIVRALRDNPLAQGEGDVTAPRIKAKAISAPFIHVRRGTGQEIAGTGNGTKIQFNAKVVDSLDLFDAVTSYRFKPNMEGLYKVALNLHFSRTITSGDGLVWISLWKNGLGGSETKFEIAKLIPDGLKSGFYSCEAFISMNGTTDFLEVWATTLYATFGSLDYANLTAIAVAKA